ncbi:MAG TPA: type II secretion system F family protein [Candidatus Hydrogenedentes bacterium]|nr:type II secretion system F family protein [Candidatus Hydrogenedentota bacterium]HPG67195.1 type II secretion system F family protein [Candidatus Hydrogenedentota bacterium]
MPANSDKPEVGRPRGRRGTRQSLGTPEVESSSRPQVPRPNMAQRPKPTGVSSVRQNEVTVFLRQFIMLVESGTPILKSLKALAERGERSGMRNLIGDIAQSVESGSPLWQAFERHPRHFDTVFVNLIKASEASGTLTTVLQRVATYRERRELLKKRIRGGMFYPVVLLLACFGVILFISKFVMPEFQDMFAKFGQAELPGLTRGFMATTDFINHWWWLCVLVVIGGVCLYRYWWMAAPTRRLATDRFKLKMPILGPILRKNAIVEMTQLFSLLLRSGLSMMVTLDLVRNAIHNRAMAEVIQKVRDSVERGEGIEPPLRAASGIVPSVVTDMMVTGEESGRLDSITDQIATTYEEEVDIAIGTLGEALQPVLTVLIGVLVVLLMLSVFVPMISMLDTLGSVGV